jgi:hypothetical protein
MAWRLEGEYFENCNCKVVCPCEASMSFEEDNERCQVIGEQLGVKFVPISYEATEGGRRAEVPGIMTNIGHPMGSSLPLAKSLEGRYDDPDWGLSFDNTGKNGNYRDFAWAA